MRIEGKRIIAFVVHKKENYEIDLADTENRLDGGTYKKTRIAVIPEKVGFIASLFSNDKYAFVGFGSKYNDNIIVNYIIRNAEIPKTTNARYVTDKIEQVLEDVLQGKDETLMKDYKYANLFNSFDMQRFMFAKDDMMPLEQFVKASDYKYTDQDHDVDNIANILDENKERIDARLKIEEIYKEDLFDAHEGVVGARLMKSLYLRQNGLKWSQIKDKRNDVRTICFGDIILPNITFKSEQLKKFLDTLKKETISVNENWWTTIAMGRYLLNMNLAGLRLNTTPKRIITDSDGDVYNIDVASFYPSILNAYKIKPKQVNDTFLGIYNDMLVRRLSFKKTDKNVSDAMKLMLNGIVGQFMIENSWLYDPEASFKIRINGALLMLMLAERLYDVAEIHCITIDGMFVKTFGKNRFTELKNAVTEWMFDSKLKTEITGYNCVYMLSNNDYIADATAKGFFSYQGNNGKNGTPDIVRIAVTKNITEGIPVVETVTGCTDIREYFVSKSSNDTLEWNGSVFNSARYYCSNNQKLCKIVQKSDFSEPATVPITDYGVTVVDEIPTEFPDDINYKYYVSEADRIASKIKVQQLNLFQ